MKNILFSPMFHWIHKIFTGYVPVFADCCPNRGWVILVTSGADDINGL